MVRVSVLCFDLSVDKSQVLKKCERRFTVIPSVPRSTYLSSEMTNSKGVLVV